MLYHGYAHYNKVEAKLGIPQNKSILWVGLFHIVPVFQDFVSYQTVIIGMLSCVLITVVWMEMFKKNSKIKSRVRYFLHRMIVVLFLKNLNKFLYYVNMFYNFYSRSSLKYGELLLTSLHHFFSAVGTKWILEGFNLIH